MVEQIESHCGLQLCVRLDSGVQESNSEVIPQADGRTLRVTKACLASTIIRFDGSDLVEIGFRHREDPVRVETATHEILHLKHILFDHEITHVKYIGGLSLPDAKSGVYNLAEYIEHIHVFREMAANGLYDAANVKALENILGVVSFLPTALARRIVGLMGWRQVSFCFPKELKAFATARLLEVGLFEDARKLELKVGPLLKGRRLPVIAECAQMIGIRPENIELLAWTRERGIWQEVHLRPASVRPPGTNLGPS